jgi:hypothetical protein
MLNMQYMSSSSTGAWKMGR